MKKFLTTLVLASSLFSFTTLLGEEEKEKQPQHSYVKKDVVLNRPYFAIGSGLPGLLCLEGGWRKQINTRGTNLAYKFSTSFPLWNQIKTDFQFLFYKNPNLRSEYYTGFGLGLMTSISILGRTYFPIWFPPSLCFEFSLGKQFQNTHGNNRFWQIQLSTPPLLVLYPFGLRGTIFNYLFQIDITYGRLKY